MRLALLSTVFAAGIAFAGSAYSAPGSNTRSITADQRLVEQVQSRRYCARLRRACENKDVRGEQGEGNCRRYRRECGRR
jgi:hypothetical protein